MKKRRKWPWIVLAAVAVVIILVIIFVSSAANGLKNTVYTRYDVKKGDVTTSITASGTLRPQDSQEIDIPDGIEVEDVLVSVGDRVSKGDRLAKVNENDAKKTASELKDSIAALDAQISAAGSTKASSVKSGVKGRVKAIYAKEGELVSSVISENGCLAIISAGGKMYADITTQTELKPKDKLEIKWENGNDEAEVLYAIQDGYRIVFDDDKAPYGKNIEVYLKDMRLGEADAQIMTPISIYSDGGRIENIDVQVNDSVSAGSTLFTLEEGQEQSAYLQLLSQREQLAKVMSDAAALVDDPYVTADADGVISAINIAKSTSSVDVQQSSASSGVSSSGSYSMMGMSQTSSLTATSANNASEQTASSSAAFVLETGDANTMTVMVNELDISSVKAGQKAEVSVDAFADKKFEAEVTSVSNYGTYDGSMSNYTVEITLKADDRLLSGMNGSAVIVSNSAENVLLVPVEAINEDAQGEFVYVSSTGNTDGSDKKQVRIKTGLSDGEFAEVLEGLNEGDKVMYTRSGMTMYEQLMSMHDDMVGKGSAQ
ncbi:MAG: HlyD family efflux transporter periplasmic adaptor subunit [Lachnospiraceae bacterium]